MVSPGYFLDDVLAQNRDTLTCSVYRLQGEGLLLVPLRLNASMNSVSTAGLRLGVFAGVIVSDGI